MKNLIIFLILFLWNVFVLWADAPVDLQNQQAITPEKPVQQPSANLLNPVDIGRIELLRAYSNVQSENINLSGENLKATAQSLNQVVQEVQSGMHEGKNESVQKHPTQPTTSDTADVDIDQSVQKGVAENKKGDPKFNLPLIVSSQKFDERKNSEPETPESLVEFLSGGDSILKESDEDSLTSNPTEHVRKTQAEFANLDHEEAVVLDSVNFTREIKGIHYLMNPPGRFHPWMKWLLYTSRITPEMLEVYYSALNKSERLYKLAVNSKGRLKIRYRGKIMDVPVYLWPDEAQGRYELVLVRAGNSKTNAVAALQSASNTLPS